MVEDLRRSEPLRPKLLYTYPYVIAQFARSYGNDRC